MKKLIFIRHAKSSWDNPALSDFDRPLAQRGLRDAPEMGRRLIQKKIIPGLIISSSAARALSTAKLIQGKFKEKSIPIREEGSLYDATVTDIIGVIRKTDNLHHTIIIIGHNPGIQNTVETLCDLCLDKFPTCGMAEMDFDTSEWKEIHNNRGSLINFDFPKSK